MFGVSQSKVSQWRRCKLNRLKALLHYNPKTGKWVWLSRPSNRVRIGDEAGCVNNNPPRRTIKIDNVYYQSSRLAVFYMTGRWPGKTVDHKNGNPLDDRWGNLRVATQSQQNANTKRRSDNKTGFKSVFLHARLVTKPYSASIRINGKSKHLGYFKTAEEAHAAYTQTAQQHFGEFARSA